MSSFNKKQKLKKWCELIEAGIIKYRPGKRKKKAAMTAKHGVIINSYKQQKRRRND